MKSYNDATSSSLENEVTQNSESRVSRRLFAGLLLSAAVLTGMTLSAVPGKAEDSKASYVKGDVVMGDPNAPVELIEYASLTCSHCAQFHTATLPDLKKNYIDTGKVKYIVREFPFDSPGLGAAMLARCGGEDRFYAIYDVLFQEQRSWATSKQPYEALLEIAKRVGISSKAFDACMQDKELMNMVVANRKEGMDVYRVESTPTLIINGDKQSGGALPYDDLKKILDDYLD